MVDFPTLDSGVNHLAYAFSLPLQHMHIDLRNTILIAELLEHGVYVPMNSSVRLVTRLALLLSGSL